MEGITQAAASRLAELDRLRRAYPEADISSVEGVLRAFVPDGRGGGTEAHAYTEREMTAKMGG